MSMDFIESLGEAKMFKTREQIAREGSRSLTDHLFVSMLSLYAMSNDYEFAPVAAEYARRTTSRGSFNSPSPGGTDLYQTIYSLQRPDEMFSDDKDAMLMGKVQVDTPKINQFLRKLARGNVSETEAATLLYRLERQLKIQDPKLRAARRLIQDWPKLNTQQQQLAVTQLHKHFRLHARRSDLMPLFSAFAKKGGFVIGSDKMGKIAKRLAGDAAAFGVGYGIGKMVGF